MKRLVVLGAGYGGLMTALKLEEKVRDLSDVEVVLVDRNDYHQFLHLSYEIVTGVKKVSDLPTPLCHRTLNSRTTTAPLPYNGMTIRKPNGVKNSAGGADPDRSSPITGESRKSASAGGKLSLLLVKAYPGYS